MLSILIPAYNFDCRPLLQSLIDQSASLSYEIEIIVLDDGSDEKHRNIIEAFCKESGTIFHTNSSNLGRSKSRNKLAKLANHDHLLFIDNDMQVMHENFIQVYIAAIKRQPEKILCGGHTYQLKKPDQSQILHWTYGREIECKSSAFMSSNFAISRTTFLDILFDESISTYGYEDSLFEQMTTRKGIAFKHIDNPLLHAQLHQNEVFLSNQRSAMKNLAMINKDSLQVASKIARFGARLKRMGLHKTVGKLLRGRDKFWVRQLTQQSKPNMQFLQMLKLSYYLKEI